MPAGYLRMCYASCLPGTLVTNGIRDSQLVYSEGKPVKRCGLARII